MCASKFITVKYNMTKSKFLADDKNSLAQLDSHVYFLQLSLTSMLPSTGLKMSCPAGLASSMVCTDSIENLRKMFASVSLVSIIANFWPVSKNHREAFQETSFQLNKAYIIFITSKILNIQEYKSILGVRHFRDQFVKNTNPRFNIITFALRWVNEPIHIGVDFTMLKSVIVNRKSQGYLFQLI